MAALFNQNPLLDGPSYSFSDTPKVNAPEGAREHRFDPYVTACRNPSPPERTMQRLISE